MNTAYNNMIVSLVNVFEDMAKVMGLTIAEEGVTPSMAIGTLFGMLADGWQTQAIAVADRGMAYKLFKEGVSEGLINPERKTFYRNDGKAWLPMPEGKGESLMILRVLYNSKIRSIKTPSTIEMCRMLAGIALKIIPHEESFIADLRKGRKGTESLVSEAMARLLPGYVAAEPTATEGDSCGGGGTPSAASDIEQPRALLLEVMMAEMGGASIEIQSLLIEAIDFAVASCEGAPDLFESEVARIYAYVEVARAYIAYRIAERQHMSRQQSAA